MNEDSLWRQIDLSAWSKVTKNAPVVRLKKDAFLFQQGCTIHSVYIVKSGRFIQTIVGRQGGEKVLSLTGVGAICGESSIFGSQPQPYNMRAVTDATLYQIPPEQFLAVLNTDLALNQLVMRILLKKVVLMASQVVDLSFGNVYQRIAGELLYLANAYGTPVENGVRLELPLTHQDLADKVQAARETVSRLMKRMSDEGILTKSGNRYVILSLYELQQIYYPSAMLPMDAPSGPFTDSSSGAYLRP